MKKKSFVTKAGIKIENQFKRILYKKWMVKGDVDQAIQEGTIARIIRIVPTHSTDIFFSELEKRNVNINIDSYERRPNN